MHGRLNVKHSRWISLLEVHLQQCQHAGALAGSTTEKLKVLNMGQHVLDSLDTPQQLYQVRPCMSTVVHVMHVQTWSSLPHL